MNPKCPDCGKRLLKIQNSNQEYICINDDCPTNIKLRKEGNFIHKEFYGTQKEINEQKG